MEIKQELRQYIAELVGSEKDVNYQAIGMAYNDYLTDPNYVHENIITDGDTIVEAMSDLDNYIAGLGGITASMWNYNYSKGLILNRDSDTTISIPRWSWKIGWKE